MLEEGILFDVDDLEILDVLVEDGVVRLTARSRRCVVRCPDCYQPSERIHSGYWRTVADLPWAECRVELHVWVRRLFCDNPACPRKTFVEQLPELMARSARRTHRLAARQRQAGLAMGGEAGCWILTKMAMPASGDTILRLIRNTPEAILPAPRVLGVDDWAWAKGQRYGTLLVDLERHQPVDLLPDRSADTLAAWLQGHPGVEVISRDRAPAYIDGCTRGAPEATQVADRWHILHNLRDALERILEQNRVCLHAAAQPEDPPGSDPIPVTELEEQDDVESKGPTKPELRRQATREGRLARYEAVIALHEQGLKQREIARQMGLARPTVRRYIEAGAFPEMAQRPKRPSILDPFIPHLETRWAAGCHNGSQLYGELQARGYAGSRSLLGHWLAHKRKQEPRTKTAREPKRKSPRSRPVRPWSARYAVWLLLKDPEALPKEKKAALERMLAASSAVQSAYDAGQCFIHLVRHRDTEALEPWLDSMMEDQLSGLRDFAKSLKQDKSAVQAALALPWSNGQVEGHVNRLKLIKRQMYGRAGFDLLRLRVLAASIG